MKYNWDAQTYDNIAKEIESWGLEILEYKRWNGDEIIIDAGCGSGKLTNNLSNKVPSGRVFAVDIDPAMIALAKEKLSDIHNVQLIQENILEIEPKEKVDVIFSNAVLHWISNHRKVFEHFWKLLKPNGQLLIQCGGHENLTKSIEVFDKIRKSEKFFKYFCDNTEKEICNNSWYFAKKEDTEILLKNIGFTNIHVFLENKIVKFNNKEEYSLYIRTIVLRPYLEFLPDEELKDIFIKSITHEIETNVKDLEWKLDYVRLNIIANK